MQITFDPRDPSQLTIIAQIVDVVSGGNAFAILKDARPAQLSAAESAERERTVVQTETIAFPNVISPEQAERIAIFTSTGAGIPQPMPAPSAANGAVPTPPVPMPSMSADSTTIPTGPTGADELDAEGLPWDARIHSSSKKKTAKGLWAARKGGPKDGELAAIKDELRGVTQEVLPIPSPTAPTPMPFPIPMPAVSEPTPMPLPTPVPMPIVAPEPTAPVPAPVSNPPAVEEWDFAKLMTHIGPKIGSGAISTEYLVQVCGAHGINSVTDTAQKPEVIPALVAQFKTDGVW